MDGARSLNQGRRGEALVYSREIHRNTLKYITSRVRRKKLVISGANLHASTVINERLAESLERNDEKILELEDELEENGIT